MSPLLASLAGLTLDRATVEAVGWSLLHFVWQGTLVAAAFALLDALLSRGRPQLRYLAGCAALLAMLAAPIATFVAGRDSTARLAGVPVTGVEPGARATVPPARRVVAPRAGARAIIAAEVAPAAPAASRSAAPRSWLQGWRERLAGSRVLPWCVALWAAGVALLSLRLLGGWWLVLRLGRSPRNLPIEGGPELLARLTRRLGVTRPVRLVRSGLVAVPTAIGWLRPMVLLPASTLTGLSPAQLEAILAHELAHIRRHDYAVNLLQSMMETLLFYHPAVWWVSRRVREERELCCDDLAVRASGDPVAYARALCELERMRGEQVRLALAASGGSLVGRIARLLGASRRPHPETSWGFAWVLVATLVMIGGAAGGAVRASHRAPHAAVEAARGARGLRGSPATAPAAAKCEAIGTGESLADLPGCEDRADCAEAPGAASCAGTAGHAEAPEAASCTGTAQPAEAPEAAVASVTACEAPTAPEAVTAEETPVAHAPRAERDREADLDPASPSPEADAEALDRFSPREWERLARAGVSRRYVANLARAGYGDLTPEELALLARSGVSSAYAARIHALLDGPAVTDLVKLAQRGISSHYVGAVRGELGAADATDLMKLAEHGISSRYVVAMHRELGEVSVEDLIRLAEHGVSSEHVAGMRQLDLDDLTADDLIRLASHGVTLEWFASLRWMGYEDVSVERAIELRDSGVSADYAASLRMLNRGPLTLEELRTLRHQGVEVEYAVTLLGLLRRDLTVDQVVRLRQQGVAVEYVAALGTLGYSELEPEALIRMHQQGVSAEYVAALAGAGYDGLEPDDLVRLKLQGVTAEFVLRVREAGYGTPEVDEMIRLRTRGVPIGRPLP